MPAMNEHPIWKHFVNIYPNDPDQLATLADVEEIEKVSDRERFPCNSVFEALDVVCREAG